MKLGDLPLRTRLTCYSLLVLAGVLLVFSVLVFLVVLPPDTTGAVWPLAGISLAIWLVAALFSQSLSRGAMRPVQAMVAKAGAIHADDLDERLPVPKPADELRDLAMAFNDLLDRVQEAFERQMHVTGEASHQLRTPLTAMLGQIEVTLRRERTPAEYQRTLGAVLDLAKRLQEIVEMLLFLARPDAESRLPDLLAVDFGEWLRQHIQETWGQHPRAAQLHIHAPAPAQARLHESLFAQAVDNLIDNAFKYCPAPTPIRLEITTVANEVLLAVADQGPGLTEADRKRVFTPFYRSTEARQRGISGVGLGLAIVARILAAHGGRAHVEANTPHGCRFVLHLPAERRDHKTSA